MDPSGFPFLCAVRAAPGATVDELSGSCSNWNVHLELAALGSDNVAVASSVGGGHALFLKADGRVFAIGSGGSGQLGVGVALPEQEVAVQLLRRGERLGELALERARARCGARGRAPPSGRGGGRCGGETERAGRGGGRVG